MADNSKPKTIVGNNKMKKTDIANLTNKISSQVYLDINNIEVYEVHVHSVTTGQKNSTVNSVLVTDQIKIVTDTVASTVNTNTQTTTTSTTTNTVTNTVTSTTNTVTNTTTNTVKKTLKL